MAAWARTVATEGATASSGCSTEPLREKWAASACAHSARAVSVMFASASAAITSSIKA